MGKVRVSCHHGRARKRTGEAFNPRHNDRTGRSERDKHIDATRANENVYWTRYGANVPFDEAELKFYQDTFGESQARKNERYIKSGHAERARTIEDVLASPKTAPLESILQLGKVKNFSKVAELLGSERMARAAIREIMWNAVIYLTEKMKPYNRNISLLDIALHADEASIHIHARSVFHCKNERGEEVVCQDKALEKCGFELPHPGEKKSRYNNRLMTYSAWIRKQWIECVREALQAFKEAHQDLEEVFEYLADLELVPEESQEHLEKNEYILREQKKELEEQGRQKEALKADIKALEEQKSKDKRLQKYEKAFLQFIDQMEADAEAEVERGRGRSRGRGR